MGKGKYTGKVEQLPKLPANDEEDPRYQDKVDAEKSRVMRDHFQDKPPRTPALLELYITVREARDDLKSRLKGAQLTLTALEQLVASRYETEGVTSVKLSTGDSVRTESAPHAVVEDPVAFTAWCRKDPDLATQLTLPWPRANALTKERLIAGEPEPPGVRAYNRTKVVLTKNRGSNARGEDDIPRAVDGPA